MKRCIQIGGTNGPITQGELCRAWEEPVRRPPLFELKQQRRATVEVDDQERTGDLIPSARHGETVQ